MKTTIYGLLGMIKDGKAPKKIKYIDKVYIFDEEEYEYYEEENDNSNGLFVELFSTYIINSFLNNEVIILETTITLKGVQECSEVNNKIEKLSYQQIGSWALEQHNWVEYARAVDKQIQQIGSKINKIIDRLNKDQI